MPAQNPELQQKITALRALLNRHRADAVLLRRVSSFSWATCGAGSYVNTAVTEGAASLVITPDRQYLATNNIEAPRLMDEEHLEDQDWEFVISPWHSPLQGLNRLLEDQKVISDVSYGQAREIAAEIARLRACLTPWEGERFRRLGKACAEILTAAAVALRPGMSEHEIAALMSAEAQRRGIQPIVLLVAADERNYRYRHPLPTSRGLQRYALLGLNARQRGLVCSITRLVHFGPPPPDLTVRIRAAARVNAALVARSRPGASLDALLGFAREAYTDCGFPDEWQRHHQGGVTGYEPREYLALPAAADILKEGQAVAWNPTIAGAKMEDTYLISDQAPELLTATSLWPEETLSVPDQPGAVRCALALEL